MPDIKTLLQDMINIGEDPEKIQAVADQYKETNPGWSVTATKEDDPEVEEIKEEEVEKIEEDDSLVYDYRTEGVKGTPGYKAAWGKSTDAGKTFEVVDVNEIPQEWYEDPKFKEVEQLEGLKVYKDDKEITWEQVKKDTKLYNSLSREEKRNLARNSKEQTTKDPLTASAAAMGSFYESDLPSTVKKGMTIVNVLKALPTIATDSEERVRLGKFMKNRIDNIPEALQTALISTQAAYMDTYRSNYLEEDGVMSGLVPEEKLKEAEEKAGELIIKKYNELSELEFKDTGKGIVAGAKDGDAASLIAGVFGAGISMAETMIPAMATGGLSLPFQIAAPMYTDYNRAKAKALYGEGKTQLTLEEEENAIRKLVENNETEIAIPMALGAVATGLEYIGFRSVDDFIRATPGKGKFLAELMWTGNKEGFTEVGQLGVERLNEGLGSGKSIAEASGDAWNAMASDEGLEMWLNGFLGSTQMSVGGRAINRALRNDNTGVKELNKKINNLADLNNKKYSTKNKDVKEALDVEIKEAEQDLKNYITQKRKISEILNEDQKQSLINIINKKDNIKSKVESLRKQVDSGAISTKEFGYAARSLNNQDKKLSEQIELINATAKEQLLQTGLEATKEEAEKLGVEQKEFEKKEDYAALFGVPGSKEYKEALEADGHISNDGKTFYVNREIAAQEGAIGVGSHELLHAIIGKSYSKLTTEAKKKLNTEFLGLLGKKEKAAILTRLAGSYGITGDKVFETEELFTAFSDEIVDGGLSFNEGVFGKIKNTVHKVLNSLGVKKEFKSARQTYNFLKDYSKNIKKGKLTERAAEFAKEDPGVEGKRMSKTRGKLVDDINDLQQGATTKADFQKPGTFNKVFESVQSGGAINNYIRSLGMSFEKTQETIDAVTDRLINFDPAAKRKDGTTIGPKGLGEFIMANVGFGKLVAAEKLFKKGEKAKRETSVDTKEAQQLEDKPTTKKVSKEGPKARKLTSLADLDIESSPLIKEVTKIKLKKLIESNPKNLIEEIQKVLISDLVEITRQEMGVIGEKAGELNIPDNYFAYLADSYEKTISSMEILKIRTNYKNLFKKEKMGFKDYKTEKSNKLSLKKDSNYRKDIFKNITNKALFTKYHTEGKKNKLIANQRNLALMRAEAEVVRAAENYIIENSADLNQVYAAELRNWIDSKTVEKQKEENKSFDSVKFSKSMALAAFEVRDAVLTGENVFDNNGNLIGSYRNILKNKKDSKAVGDFVWANLHLLSPETDFKFLRKAYETLYSDDRGTAYETNLIKVSELAEKIYGIDALEVVLRKPTESDALPDMILKIHGVTMNIEAKMALAQYSSVTNSIVDGNMVVEKQYSPEFMEILAELQKESQKGVKKAKKFLKENGIKWDGIKSLSTEAHNMLKNNYDIDTRKSFFNGMSATLPLSLKFIAEIYNNKKHPVFLMQLMGRGLFSMGGDTFNLGIPALEDGGDGFITLRVGSTSQYRVVTQADVDAGLVKSIYTDGTNTKKKGETKTKRKIKTGMKNYAYRSIPGISDKVLNDMKSSHNIEHLAGMMKFMDSKEVANMKMSRSAKNKQTFNNAIKRSQSATNESKGITVLDFDDTLATTKSNILTTAPDGTKGKMNAEEYASNYEDLAAQGYKFDFSEFNKVVKGKKAPLFEKALKLQSKFGPENMFILTARPPAAQKAIFDFLKANGLNIPIKNITGLGNSTAEAKALWVADKVGEGFNDFYFADDALQNTQAVKNMLDQFDVKSKVQQAKVDFVNGTTKFSRSVNRNKIEEEADRLSRLTYQDYTDIGGETAPNTDIIGYRSAYSITNESTSEYESKKRAWENRYKEKKELREKQGEEFLKSYDENVAKVNEYIEDESKLTYSEVEEVGNPPNTDIIGYRSPWSIVNESTDQYQSNLSAWQRNKNKITEAREKKALESVKDQDFYKRMVEQEKEAGVKEVGTIKFSKSMNNQFNDILENVKGIESKKRFSAIKARKRGDSKGKFRFFIPPSHEDFVGLLYNFMGKGKEGNAHRDFFETALVRPLNRAYREIDTAKQAIANDYKALNKQFKNVKNKLIKNTPDGDFTFQDAIRVYLWNKHGYKIPGLTPTDQASLVSIVTKDSELQAYAETLNVISKQEKYVDPGQSWEAGNIRIDLVDATGRVGRKQYFAEFNENAEVLFSPENLNKIEAAYGKDFREALEDMLHRIKTGINRPKGASAKPNMFMNWLNASVSGVMFFNTRSALLQQLSNVNFLNFADNNIYAAGKAFANQPQYWKDFAMIFNSDMIKQRRGGLQTDINGAELAEAIKKARPDNMFDQVAIITGKALRLGFLPTQIGDNIAIATGGAAFYRNRVNKYIKDGLTVKEAESKAFIDLQDITNSTQQSARPDMSSQQQASWIGKLVLNFLNTPSQYNRIIKKAGSDIKNRRITPPNTKQTQSDMSNVSRILYYGAAQNLIFYSLQTALFAVMFGGEDEDEEKRVEQFLKKKERVINGTIDTILRGSGIYGVAVSTLKNMIIKFLEQRDPTKYNKDEAAVLTEALNFSPVIGIKARRIVNAEKTINYNESVMGEMETFDAENPMWSAVTNYTQSITGAPVNKIYQKTINLRNAADNKYTALQRALFFSGYTTWSLNLGDTEKIEKVKEVIKEKKKVIAKEKVVIKKAKKIEEKKKEGEDKQAKEKKEGKEVTCLICKLPVVSGKKYCTVHEKVKQRKDGAKVQCKKMKQITKKKTKQCGVMTSNKSGLCYYHD